MMGKVLRRFMVAGIAAGTLMPALPAQAANVIDEWASVQIPAAPALKAVTVDPQTTALLMLDFMQSNCGKRPRCLATLPAMKSLLAQARARNMLVVYSVVSNTTAADVLKEVAPQAGEPWVLSGPDKFVNTNLEQILKDKGIKTVITVGTVAQGAVLYTAAGAAFRGFNVIVPVDGMSAESAYPEIATVSVLMLGPTSISTRATLTRSDMIKL